MFAFQDSKQISAFCVAFGISNSKQFGQPIKVLETFCQLVPGAGLDLPHAVVQYTDLRIHRMCSAGSKRLILISGSRLQIIFKSCRFPGK